MGSRDAGEVRALLAEGKMGSIVTDLPLFLRIKYVGTGTVTSVVLTTGTNLVLTSSLSTVTSTFATDTDMGKVVDRINASAEWEAKILDCLRADASASKMLGTTIAVSSLGYYDIYGDTSATLSFTYRCAFDRGVGACKPKGAHRVKFQEAKYLITLGSGDAANGFRIYEWDHEKKVETQIYRVASTSGAATTINVAAGNGVITGGWGNDLIIRVIDASTLGDAAANYMNVSYIAE